MLLRKPPAEVEIWNDLNDDLVNLFRVLRTPCQASELLRSLAATPYARKEQELAFEPCAEPVERARRLIVRSFFTIGSDAASTWRRSGFRTYSDVSKVGSAPVQSWATYPAALEAIIERIQGRVIIENRDALRLIEQHDSSITLFYCDPPYPISTRTDANPDYAHEMTDDEHRGLAGLLRQVQGKVVLGGYPCALYDQELFPDWYRVEKETVASSAGMMNRTEGKMKRIEVLWCNYDPAPILAPPEPEEEPVNPWQQTEMDFGEEE